MCHFTVFLLTPLVNKGKDEMRCAGVEVSYFAIFNPVRVRFKSV